MAPLIVTLQGDIVHLFWTRPEWKVDGYSVKEGRLYRSSTKEYFGFLKTDILDITVNILGKVRAEVTLEPGTLLFAVVISDTDTPSPRSTFYRFGNEVWEAAHDQGIHPELFSVLPPDLSEEQLSGILWDSGVQWDLEPQTGTTTH